MISSRSVILEKGEKRRMREGRGKEEGEPLKEKGRRRGETNNRGKEG